MNLEAMPNPFSEITMLNFVNISEDALLNIYDITGKQVLSQNILPGTESISIGEELIPGIYTVQFY